MIKTKRALLIGVSSYDEESIYDLPKVITDVNGLASTLLSTDISAFDHIDKLCGETSKSMNLKQIQFVIEDFLQKSQDEELSVIYIASHAAVFYNVLHILPEDFDPQKPMSSSLPITFISSCIQNCKSESVLIILDCCYANSAAWDFFSNQKMPFELDDERFNLCLIASTRKEEPAIDGGFTPFLIEAIKRLEPKDNEKVVNVDRIFNYAREKMENQIFQCPIKWQWGSHSIPIGRLYSGFWASKASVEQLYSIMIDKKLKAVSDTADVKLDYIEEEKTEHGFKIRTGLRVLEGRPNRKIVDCAIKDLETAIDKRCVDKGLLIVSDNKDFMNYNTESVRIVSFLDFKKDLDPFYDYLDKKIKDYEESDIYKLGCYINLKGHSEDGKKSFVLDDYILRWATSSGKINHTTVLGDFGTGKTTTAKHIFWIQAKRYLENSLSERIPVFINLRDYAVAFNMRTLIERTLSEQVVDKRLTYHLIQELNKKGKILWILDGFDEMATRVNERLMKKNFSEILKIAEPQSRLLLTCRTHFFKNRDEVTNTLKGTELYDQLRKEAQYKLIFVDPFSQEDIKKYVQIRLKDQANDFLKILFGNPQLKDLASRPILLEMIIITLPKLIESGATLNLPNLYEQYARIWLNRDEWRTEMTVDERFTFCQNLAWHFFTESKYEINYSELPEFIKNQFPDELTKQDLEFLAYDIQTTTFLHRDVEGNYSFSHKSFLEFFAASYISMELKKGNTEALKIKIIPHEILNFLGGMIQDSPNILEQVEILSRSNKFNLKFFSQRFLRPRIFPYISRKHATNYIHQKYTRHLFIHLILPAIFLLIGLIIYSMKTESSLKENISPGVLLFLVFTCFLVLLYFGHYLFLTISGKAGDPIFNFNTLALCHFGGLKIEVNTLEMRKRLVDINQQSIADLVVRVIQGLPLGEQVDDKVVGKKCLGKKEHYKFPKPNRIAILGAIVGIIYGTFFGLDDSGLKLEFVYSIHYRFYALCFALIYLKLFIANQSYVIKKKRRIVLGYKGYTFNYYNFCLFLISFIVFIFLENIFGLFGEPFGLSLLYELFKDIIRILRLPSIHYAFIFGAIFHRLVFPKLFIPFYRLYNNKIEKEWTVFTILYLISGILFAMPVLFLVPDQKFLFTFLYSQLVCTSFFYLVVISWIFLSLSSLIPKTNREKKNSSAISESDN